MRLLPTLRHPRFLARFVLAWWLVSLGAAIASPIVKPKGMTLVCAAAGGLKLVASGEPGLSRAGVQTLDCPVCTSVSAPPPLLRCASPMPELGRQGCPAVVAIAPRVQAKASPPSRGPPAQR